MDKQDALNEVKSRFEYTRDRLDRWRIMKNTTGPLKGDCEDFALTVLYNIRGRSTWKTLWALITLRAKIRNVKALGVGHAVLYYDDMVVDNIEPRWRYSHGYSNGWRVPVVIILIKMLPQIPLFVALVALAGYGLWSRFSDMLGM